MLPADAYERAQARIWSDHINKFIIRPFYAYLMKGVKEEGMKIVDGLLQVELLTSLFMNVIITV